MKPGTTLKENVKMSFGIEIMSIASRKVSYEESFNV